MDTFEPYEQVKQATAQLMRALADQAPGVESLWVRHESYTRPVDDGDDSAESVASIEVAREWSFVLESGFVLAVRARSAFHTHTLHPDPNSKPPPRSPAGQWSSVR